ncbi:MAG: radical SAM protein [Hyphomonadaceae bacterium]|nr:radical SAM protein [Hyphomonadaceae bacterium]
MAGGNVQRLDPAKFRDPRVTAKGEPRATVTLGALRTLWFNTGTLCNIACKGCYIESSPSNDRLVYLSPQDVAPYLDEIAPDVEVGFTGGEPFLNPHIIELIGMSLALDHPVIVLTNAMRPMLRPRVMEGLLTLQKEYGEKLVLRVSLDHPEAPLHDAERGEGGFDETLAGIDWLCANGFAVHVAGRMWGAEEADLRARYADLFAARDWRIDAASPRELVLFPEMDVAVDVPEITTACWGILGLDPAGLMCSTSRMIVRRAGAAHPVVVTCTLLPYEPAFELGATLAGSARTVPLNHPHCAKFCVLGGGKCAA